MKEVSYLKGESCKLSLREEWWAAVVVACDLLKKNSLFLYFMNFFGEYRLDVNIPEGL